MMWEPQYVEEIKRVECIEDLSISLPIYAKEVNEKFGIKGWLIKDWNNIGKWIEYVRWNPTDEGDCGLKSKEPGCFYPG